MGSSIIMKTQDFVDQNLGPYGLTGLSYLSLELYAALFVLCSSKQFTYTMLLAFQKTVVRTVPADKCVFNFTGVVSSFAYHFLLDLVVSGYSGVPMIHQM